MESRRDDRPAAVAPRAPVRIATNLDVLAPWLIAALAACLLYFGQSVLVPVTLAIILSFLLAPIVSALHRLRLPRGVAVLVAVLLSLGVLAGSGLVIANQAATLSRDAPAYATRLTAKAAALRNDLHDRLSFIFRENDSSGSRKASRARKDAIAALQQRRPSAAIPVEIQAPPPTPIQEFQSIALPVLPYVETTAIVLILAVFFLLQKQDLSDRLIRLLGARDLVRTTVALDDAAKRLSRYFLAQFVVNAVFGAIVWGGLLLIGIPSPGLWGILAGLLRFVPYIGSLAAALAPLALAAAIDPGWELAGWVVLLFAVVEPVTGYVVEPLVYGRSTGLSPVSVVLAAIVWTALWGPVGLVLSMPLTLMLVVLGRHIPAFQIFDLLLGDRPALTPAEAFYQRVLAGHPDAAIDHADELLTTMTLAQYYDDVALAALRLAAADVDRGTVAREAMTAVCDNSIEVVNALADYVVPPPPGTPRPTRATRRAAAAAPRRQRVLVLAARGLLDRAVAAMAAQLLERCGYAVGEVDRSLLRDETPGALDADIVVVVGLFDDRSFRRVAVIAERLAAIGPRTAVLVGVTRLADGSEIDEVSGASLIGSLAALCDKVGEAEPTLPSSARSKQSAAA